jgi:glycosyltransferase involved in cell wall biosynthesis
MIKKSLALSLLLSLSLFGGTAFSQERCQEVFDVSDAQALAYYDLLKAKDPSTLLAKTEYDKDVLLTHLRKVANGRPILIFTDGSFSQASGVVTVMKIFQEIETRFGIKLKLVVPGDFKRVLKVNYQDTILGFPSTKEVNAILKEQNPFAVHIMVEGTVGKKVRSVLLKNKIPFTSAYHTDFPKYVSSTVNIPILKDVLKRLTYRLLKGFHKPSEGVMVPTQTMKEELVKNGFEDSELRNWSHGVDIVKFDPSYRSEETYAGLKRPISLYVGRVAPEKNLEAFLAMKTPGTKVIIGDGPSRAALQEKYPDTVFLGRKPHEQLPEFFASSDVFVFPSLTDTFGLVLLEAAASGTPVLAFNVQGPKDAISSQNAGVLVKHDADFAASVRSLEQGFNASVNLNRDGVRKYAEEHSWETSLLEFLFFLKPL